MKKFISLIALVLSVICIFTACKKEAPQPNPEDGYASNYYDDEPLDKEEFKPNVFKTIEDLCNFFEIEDVANVGAEYEFIFNTVRKEGVVIKPLMAGEDVSLQPEFARIIVNPAKTESDYSYIAYHYTNGVYNTTVKVYYLNDAQYNIASIAGLHALNNGNEETVSRGKYGDYSVVENLSDHSTYAERFIYEKYFITVTGAHISKDNAQSVIETDILDILSFEFEDIRK